MVDLQADLLGEHSKAPVVIAALPARFLHATDVCQSMCGLVQLRAEHACAAAPEPFTADEQLGEMPLAGVLPSVGVDA